MRLILDVVNYKALGRHTESGDLQIDQRISFQTRKFQESKMLSAHSESNFAVHPRRL